MSGSCFLWNIWGSGMQICNATSHVKIIHFLPMHFGIQVVWGLGAHIFRGTLLNIVTCADSQGIRVWLGYRRIGIEIKDER